MTTRDDQNLKNITLQLASSIDSQIQFYSDDDRIYFIENVITIMMTSDSASIKTNMKNFVVENYENGYELSEDINEGIGNFLRGVAKGVGRVLGFGRPAEKIAFGAPPTTHDTPSSAVPAPTEKIIKRVPTTRKPAPRTTKQKPTGTPETGTHGTSSNPGMHVTIHNAANSSPVLNTGAGADVGRSATNTTTRDSYNDYDNHHKLGTYSDPPPTIPLTVAKPTVDATRAADGSARGNKKPPTAKKPPKGLPMKESVDPMAGYVKGYANRFLRG